MLYSSKLKSDLSSISQSIPENNQRKPEKTRLPDKLSGSHTLYRSLHARTAVPLVGGELADHPSDMFALAGASLRQPPEAQLLRSSDSFLTLIFLHDILNITREAHPIDGASLTG